MFETWLRELRLAKKGGVRLAAASRGREYVLRIAMPGDLTANTVRGQVRSAPDAVGSPLATFFVTAPTFSSGQTTFRALLPGGTSFNATGSLPEDANGDGTAEFVFDFIMTAPDQSPELLFGGVLPVVGRVTI